MSGRAAALRRPAMAVLVFLGIGAAAVVGSSRASDPSAAAASGSSSEVPRTPSSRSDAPGGCTREAAEPASACAACHPVITRQWRDGRHAEAFDDPLFRAEYDPSPSRFCRDCHASGEAEHQHDPHDGVDCSGCHPPAAVLASLDGPARPGDGSFMCARCHQFDFPEDGSFGHGVYDPADPLQDTVHEWQRSRAAAQGRGCVDCHMPRTSDAEPRSHRLLDTHDPEFLAQALEITAHAERGPEGIAVELRLDPDRVGHRVPTGDMFRRLRLSVWTDGTPPEHRWLGRFFAQMPASDDDGFRLRPVLDDRVAAPGTGPATTWRVVLPPHDATHVEWSVQLHRMPPEQARDRGLSEASVRAAMASGRVAIRSAIRSAEPTARPG